MHVAYGLRARMTEPGEASRIGRSAIDFVPGLFHSQAAAASIVFQSLIAAIDGGRRKGLALVPRWFPGGAQSPDTTICGSGLIVAILVRLSRLLRHNRLSSI